MSNAAPGRPSPRPDLTFTPVRNGMDYLERAVADLTEGATPPSARDLKYAVLHLQAATEVLLKARLVGEHWSLVFKDPGSATMEEFQKGGFKSCDTDETIKRLAGIARVEIPSASRIAIKNLSSDRNALMHYGHTGDAFVVEARAVGVLGFLLDFVEGDLRPMLKARYQDSIRSEWEGAKGLTREDMIELLSRSPEVIDIDQELFAVDVTMQDLRTKLGRIEKLVDQRMKSLSGQLKPVLHRTIRCPDCRQWALVVATLRKQGDQIYCRFCLLAYDNPKSPAYEYLQHVIGQDNGAVVGCPSCDSKSLVLGANTADNPHEDVGLCFSCGETAEEVINGE
ncbi:hypothetical protein ACFY40_27755 [Streptomyces sp. NPDC012950]|uniref:hypothetical protein n=1 Tax=Streptomyces sp. NPDC012950 TaxID=3364858 RepID=UPI003688256E